MSSKIKYDSYGNSIEGTDYCTGVETFAQNLIEDNSNDASITFPCANGWMIPRSIDFKTTSENARLIVDCKIYKIMHLYLKGIPYVIKNGSTNYLSWSDITDKDGNTVDEYSALDASRWVVSEERFNTLPTPANVSEALNYALNVCNTFYYSDDSIYFGKNFAIKFGSDYTSVYFLTEVVRSYYSEKYYYNGKKLSENSNTGIMIYGGGYPNSNYYKELQFRVEYIPMSTNTKIRARKRASGNVEYIQPINQRAEINSASALGKFLYSAAQKTGTEQITLVKWYTKIKDIPQLGCRVKHNGEHYILTANTFEMTNCVQIKVTHTLSKNWSNKSQYVSVDQKYRNYKIPADILWRNLYWEDFIEITTDGAVAEAVPGSLISSVISEGKTLTPILPRIFMCDSTNDVTITSFFICKSSDGTGATAPCTTMGMANSMIFSASMKDNLSAGLQIDPENSDYCKKVFYCNENGTLNNAYIVLSTGIQNQDSAKYPAASLLTYGDYNNPQDTIFLHEYHIDKDKGEALKFTYQCHWTSREDNIVIGSKLAENHPLIKEWTEDRKFKFWVLKQPLRQGTDKVYANASESVLITTDYERKLNYFGIGDIATPTTVKAFKVELLGIALAAVKRSETKAWAITDENNNLYVGCNDTAKTVLYFTHIHKRK